MRVREVERYVYNQNTPYGAGKPFVRVAGADIDIGAFELQLAGPPLPGDYNQNGLVDAANYTV